MIAERLGIKLQELRDMAWEDVERWRGYEEGRAMAACVGPPKTTETRTDDRAG